MCRLPVGCSNAGDWMRCIVTSADTPVLDVNRHPFEVMVPVRDELGRETGTLVFDSRWSNPWAASERADAIGGIVR